MTPTEILMRCGFRRTGRRGEQSVQMVYKPAGISPDARRTDLRLEAFRLDSQEPFYRATIAMKNRQLTFDTSDIRDVAALALDYRNWLEPPHVVDRDPARSMRTESGPNALPFHEAGGEWGVDEYEVVTHPAHRWGAAYEEHRDRWFQRIVGQPMAAAPEEYLEAAGFVQYGNIHRLVTWPRQNRPGAEEADRLQPVFFDVVGTSTPGRRHVVRAIDASGSIPPLAFESDDVRDLLAFVTSVENVIYDEAGPQVLDGSRVVALPGGTNELRNPFGEHENEDRWLGLQTAAGDFLVANPVFTLGHLYVSWRDRWASDVLANGAPRPCNPDATDPDSMLPLFTPGMVSFLDVHPGICSSEGGDVQEVAVFEDITGGRQILMGRAFLEHRLDTLRNEGLACELEANALIMLEANIAMKGSAPAFG